QPARRAQPLRKVLRAPAAPVLPAVPQGVRELEARPGGPGPRSRREAIPRRGEKPVSVPDVELRARGLLGRRQLSPAARFHAAHLSPPGEAHGLASAEPRRRGVALPGRCVPMSRGMKVVLFCGGLGTRLREHSDTIPKPLVNIGYRPIIWHLMRYYAHFGHKDFILCLGYRGDLIKEYFVNYSEWMSNDFVLSNGCKTIEPVH